MQLAYFKRAIRKVLKRSEVIEGEIMYGIEHLVEVPIHTLLYGEARIFSDSWLSRCMEGRMNLRLADRHRKYPKGISKDEYEMEGLVIEAQRYFIANCAVFDKMKTRAPRQFAGKRWTPPWKYQLPFLIDPSDVASESCDFLNAAKEFGEQGEKRIMNLFGGEKE